MLGLSLFYVGAVLFLNGLWMLDRICRQIWVINIFTGVVSAMHPVSQHLGPAADAASVKSGALTLLFAFTYLWVAFNRFSGCRRPRSGLVQPVRGDHRCSRRPRYADQRQFGLDSGWASNWAAWSRTLGLVLCSAGPSGKSIERPTGSQHCPGRAHGLGTRIP